MIRVISKQLTLALTVISFSLSPIHVFAQDKDGKGGEVVNAPKDANIASDPGGGAPAGLDTSKGGPTGNDSSGKKLDDAPMDNAINSLKQAKGMSATMVTPTFEVITKEYAEYKPTKESCVSRHAGAANACLEHLSPNILTGITTLNTILSTLGGAAVKDQCSGFANAMDIAKAAMTAYTAACGTMKAGCGLSCVGARKGLEKMQKAKSGLATCPDPNDTACPGAAKAYNAALGSLDSAAAKELVPGQEESMAGKAKLCTEKYAQLLTSGLAGIASLLNSINQGKKCEEESNGSTTPQVADVCSDPAKAQTEECLCKNPQSPQCICFKNPRTAGCSTGLAGVGENSAGSQVATGATDKSNVVASAGTPNLGGGDGGMQLGERNPSSADGGGIGAPTGGGAGLGGSGGGSGGGAGGRGEESAGKKGLDTNILGGTGGGGGGGSWGAYGGGSSSEKYRAYLPGGAKDPNKAAGQQAWTKEVTGQGGKSNWEKVKERYRDNKNTLLNN
ncbi:hypothetical protein [Bdellovibrio sp. BCCA]|uniref:hypothetical protein n=1 Tax=Bdellovibrio sp. BCCA TaxID=3136281 RepID=UPI0030F00AEA